MRQDRLKELLHYDQETGVFTAIAPRGKRSDLVGKPAGTITPDGYRVIAVEGRKYRATHLAHIYMNGRLPDSLMDHRNHQKSDDRWDNIRPANKAQNEQNKGLRASNSSGCTGVYFNKAAGKWQAYITVMERPKYLGIFREWFDAVCARKAAEAKHFGEFAFRG